MNTRSKSGETQKRNEIMENLTSKKRKRVNKPAIKTNSSTKISNENKKSKEQVINRYIIENVELRSDVKTLPTMKMRESVLTEDFGDSWAKEDQVVNKLENNVANFLGFERGLFVNTGPMGNSVCILVYAQRGDYVIQGELSHLYKSEIEFQKVFGIEPICIKNKQDGSLELDENILLDLIEKNKYIPDFVKRIKLICLENTHNLLGGKVLPLNYIETLHIICENVRKIHNDFNPKFHLDGSRLLNSAVKLNVEPNKICKGFNSVCISLYKNLGAPAGGIVCLENKLFDYAFEFKRVLGGALRQAGFLANPGLIALEDWKEKLVIDHDNAKRFYEGIKSIRGLSVNEPETNILTINLEGKYKDKIQEFTEKLQKRNVYVLNMNNGEYIRAVIHYQVSLKQIKKTIKVFKEVSKELLN